MDLINYDSLIKFMPKLEWKQYCETQKFKNSKNEL